MQVSVGTDRQNQLEGGLNPMSTNYNLKAREALKSFIDRIEAGEKLHVTISHGNVKMGKVPSASTLPGCAADCGGTCPAVCRGTCGVDCYARKIANLRPSVLNSYAKNTAILLRDPQTYWEDINLAISAARFFRFLKLSLGLRRK